MTGRARAAGLLERLRERWPDARDERRAPSGWRIVAAKELADDLRAARFPVLILILGLAAVLAVYGAAGPIRDNAPQASRAPEVFLRLFTIEAPPGPALFWLIGFLAPLLGIAFGFDAITGERTGGTLPRLLSQPIHRDDVINGKFAAGLIVISVVFGVLTAIVAGVGVLRLSITPSGESVMRLLAWFVVTVVYFAFWLAFATLC